MQDSYLTVSESSIGRIKVERSEFIGQLIPVLGRESAEQELEIIHRKYHDATHNCYAYRIGVEPSQEFHYSDDGEPSGTAGKPIYDAILSGDLTNILLVVTRYFGGVKLGTGGLGRAYREAAMQVIQNARIVERFLTRRVKVQFGHDQTSLIMRVLDEFSLKPTATEYAEKVTLFCEVRLGMLEQFKSEIAERSQGKLKVESC